MKIFGGFSTKHPFIDFIRQKTPLLANSMGGNFPAIKPAINGFFGHLQVGSNLLHSEPPLRGAPHRFPSDIKSI